MVGQLLGVWVAGHLRSRITWTRAQRVDAGIGSLLGVVSVLLVAWMVAVPLASSPYPSLASAATHSRIVRGVNDVMPNGVRQLYSSLRSFLDQSGFPPVFGDLPSLQSTNVAPPAAVLPPAVQAEVTAAHRSVFKIYGEAPSCSRGIEGSGFVFAPQHMLTNAHVVAGTSQVSVQVSARQTLRAKVVLFDPRRDVAVLDVPGLKATPLAFSPSAASTGDPAVVLGYPEDGPFNVQSARIRDRSKIGGSNIYGKSSVDREIYSLRATVRSGNSGGPLIADNGTVLGIVFATSLESSDTGYALTAGEVSADAGKGANATTSVGTQGCTPG
jgi:S1-C subfamily serine protease